MLVLYYPPEIENRTLAKQILEDLALGKDVTIPQLVDDYGNKLWVLDSLPNSVIDLEATRVIVMIRSSTLSGRNPFRVTARRTRAALLWGENIPKDVLQALDRGEVSRG